MARTLRAESTSLIPELEEVLRGGSADKRARTLQQITDLFIHGSRTYNEDHVELFDAVLGRLVEEIEARALAELAARLAPVDNAPRGVVQRLARDDNISIAGPLLKQSQRLADSDLAEIARSKGQDHLLAISERRRIDETVTDILVVRGDQQVARQVAANRGARLSEAGFNQLVDRAERDDILAVRVGQRPDIPAHIFRDLVMRATDLVQKRLLAAARPETRAEISRVLAKVSQDVSAKPVYDFRNAQRTVLALQKAGKLDQRQLAAFADEEKFEETAAALSMLCAVRIDVIQRLMTGEQADPVLILCKAAGFDWSTAQSIMTVCGSGKKPSRQAINDANANFDLLSQAAAQRVVRFWQAKPTDGADAD
jgi:uncharacterized protein (DUF2336 family)